MGKKLFGEDYAKMTHALITKMVKQGKTDDEIQKATGEHGKRIELIRKNIEKKKYLEKQEYQMEHINLMSLIQMEF